MEADAGILEPDAIARQTPVTRAVTECAADMAYAAVAEPHQLGDQCPYRSDFIDSRADAVCRLARRKAGEWNFSPLQRSQHFGLIGQWRDQHHAIGHTPASAATSSILARMDHSRSLHRGAGASPLAGRDDRLRLPGLRRRMGEAVSA